MEATTRRDEDIAREIAQLSELLKKEEREVVQLETCLNKVQEYDAYLKTLPPGLFWPPPVRGGVWSLLLPYWAEESKQMAASLRARLQLLDLESQPGKAVQQQP